MPSLRDDAIMSDDDDDLIRPPPPLVSFLPIRSAKMAPPADRTPEQVIEAATGRYLPKDVPALAKRWNPNMDFGEFTAATVSAYHQEALENQKKASQE